MFVLVYLAINKEGTVFSLECKFDDPVPQCIKDAKEFCERHLREEILPKTEKQRLVR